MSFYIFCRTAQPRKDTTPHATAASDRTPHAGTCAAKLQITIPNANRPMLPMAAPTAVTPAAWQARSGDRSPCDSSRSRSCFSTSVKPAGRIAGKARNKPPTVGPNRWAINPAIAVISPPKTNRTANAFHFVLFKLESCACTFLGITDCSLVCLVRESLAPD